MQSQIKQVMSRIAAGDLVYASSADLVQGIYCVSCLTAFGPILVGEELAVPAWSEVKILPPF